MVFFAFAATCCVLPSEAPACTVSQVAPELDHTLTVAAHRAGQVACSRYATGQTRVALFENYHA